MTAVLEFLGRLHPVLVHLPIGIFLLLAAAELVGLFPRAPRLSPSQRTFVLALGLLVALATSWFGWLLSREGGYNAELLDRHQWSGFTFAALAAILLAVHLAGWRRIYGGLLVVSAAVLTAAGHFGGTLTHGENYLTASNALGKRPIPKKPSEAQIFADVIHPLLEQRCVSCHGPTKSNGDLRYDSLVELLRGGKSGPAFKPGAATASRMIQRLHLPIDAKEHMPPKGRTQLTDDEVALLEWWIDAGAPTTARVTEVSPPATLRELILTKLGIPPPPLPDRAKMLAAAEVLERQLGIVIRPLAADEPWLEANARLLQEKFGDRELAALATIAPALRWLDLGETSVTDAGLAAVGSMTNLRRLHLDRTAISDAGLPHLAPLAQLEALNLHATSVTNAGLVALEALPRLRSLYLWQTKVTPEAVAKLGERQTDRRRIARWRSEIAALEANIRAEHFNADFGAGPKTKSSLSRVPVALPSPAAIEKEPETNATTKDAVAPAATSAPINARCPVSGEPIDAAVTERHGGRLIGFCCTDCRDKFRAEPAKYPVK
jgi:uncharacterized membrane protein/mono/diheme cytochrome c family protein